MKPETLAVHAGYHARVAGDPIMPPVVLSSTFLKPDPEGAGAHSYSRISNPNRDALEQAVAALEGARHGLAFASGVAACTAVLQTLRPGDHVVAAHDLYGGTQRLLTGYVDRHGATVSFVDLHEPVALDAALRDQTRLVWVETPSNPMLHVVALEPIARLARSRGARLVVDNTFMTPLFMRPLALGADVVVHSTTKYLNGHSDVVGGLVLCDDDALAADLRFIQGACGAVPSPFDCFLVQRGLKTLAVRMRAHERGCLAIADALTGHPRVRTVRYPGHPSHPQHAAHVAQADGGGGVVTIGIDGGTDEVRRLMGALQLFTPAESLGGVESLIGHPATSSHRGVPPAQRAAMGITDGVVRLSVGIEHPDDLVADLLAALDGL